jgi:hypothetical protein
MSSPPDYLDPATSAGKLYEELLHRPHAETSILARHAGVSPQQAGQTLALLARYNVVVQSSDDSSGARVWEAVQPSSVSRERFAVEERRLATARQRLDTLNEIYWLARRTTGTIPAIEVLHSRHHRHVEHLRLQQDATSTVRALDRTPHTSHDDPNAARQQSELQRRRMDAGVEYRVVYQSSLFADPDAARLALEQIPHGEHAKQAPQLPMNLTIADDTRAFMSLEPRDDAGDAIALLVHPSALLDGLIIIFEHFWAAGAPIDNSTGLDPRGQMILGLLAGGATDNYISHHTGLSMRTVARVIADLLDQLGAETRFQAGLEAHRRGWL